MALSIMLMLLLKASVVAFFGKRLRCPIPFLDMASFVGMVPGQRLSVTDLDKL
ncbi:MAG: hypothetical protein Roseis2KO_48130 [Roseivirga sp.]